MDFMNLGIGEILFILIIALIIFGPNNMVKTARDMGALLRKVTKSPYWQEVWAAKRELTEIPKIIVKEAQLEQTINELNQESKGIKSSLSSSVSEFIKEINQPVIPIESVSPQVKVEPEPVELKFVEPKSVELKPIEPEPVEPKEK
jgi:Sec-independent protein translocase protein TatA